MGFRPFSVIFGLLIAIQLAPISRARADNATAAEELSGLSLEQLSNIHVTVPSKFVERQSDAPGVVTTYTAREMETLGYYTLGDLAEITPGYSTITRLQDRIFETRGQTSERNEKHLLLIDGIPVNNSRNWMAYTQEQLPLYFADHVEFLRGPGSALYGTGAISGVINIVPKTLDEVGSRVENKVSVGTPETPLRLMSNYLARGEETFFRGSVGYFHRNASLLPVGTVPPNPSNQYRDDREAIFIDLDASITNGDFAGVAAGFILMNMSTGYGEGYVPANYTSPMNFHRWETLIPYLKFDRQITKRFSVDAYLKYNGSLERGRQVNFVQASPYWDFSFDTYTDDLEWMTEARWNLSDTASFILGADLDIRGQSPSRSWTFISTAPGIGGLTGERLKTISLYGEGRLVFPALSGLIATIGARYDAGYIQNQSYNQLSPRVSLVQKLSDETDLKLLYGSALRAPGVFEYSTNIEKAPLLVNPQVIPNLLAESLHSIELAVTHSVKNFAGSVTLFKNFSHNVLSTTPPPGTNLVWVNPANQAALYFNEPGWLIYQGFEVDLHYSPVPALAFFGNFSQALSIEPPENQNVYSNGLPEAKLNLGANYVLNEPFKLNTSLVARWVSTYTDPNGSDYPGQLVVDMNLIHPVSDSSSVELLIQNLADRQYYQPKNGVPVVPQPGRSFLVSFSKVF